MLTPRLVVAAALCQLLVLGACADEPTPTCRDRGDCDLGESCEQHDHCESQLCLAVEPSAAAADEIEPLVCSQGCAGEDECGDTTSCRLVVVTRDDEETGQPVEGVEGACLPSFAAGGLLGDLCQRDEDCRAGLCHAARCTERCGGCGPGAVCEVTALSRLGYDLELGLCQWSLAAPNLELGPLDVDVSGSAEIALEIPSGLASFTVIAHYPTDDDLERVGVLSLVAPDGTVLADADDDLDDLNPPSNRYPGASSVLVPATDTPLARPQAGTYLLRVGLFETDYVTFTPIAGTLDGITVVFERLAERGGLLDLNLYFAPGTDLTAADAASSDYVTTLRTTLEDFFAEHADLRLGIVNYGDVAEADYDSVDDSDRIRDICERYSDPGPHRAALNVVLIDEISFTDGYTAGAPSPPGVFGGPASCIVIDKRNDPRRTGLLLAHEVGHFLGLRHTTRLNPNPDGGYDLVGYDPIGDTPTCPSGTALESCPDYHNLMFPFFPFSDLSLSAGQAAVIRANPLLYELDRPRLCSETPATWDLTSSRYATASTDELDNHLAGSCGGSQSPERLHVYRLRGSPPPALEITVRGRDFAPTVYVREDTCDADAREVACDVGAAGEDVTVRVEAPTAERYFIAVDGSGGTAGRFVLTVAEVEASPPPE